MQRLVWGCLVALTALTAPACIITTDNGDDVPGGLGLITADWNFKQLATDSIITQCPPGFDTTAVHATRTDAAQSEVIDLYDCAALTGTPAQGYPVGVYDVFLAVTDSSGANVYATSLPAEVDITASDKTYQTTLLDDGGYFALAWNLVDAATSAPLSCADAGNPDSIEIISTVSGAMTAFTDKFTCQDGGGVTAGLLAGSYEISVSALNAQNQALGAPQNDTNQVIGDRNQVTNLGTFTLPIE